MIYHLPAKRGNEATLNDDIWRYGKVYLAGKIDGDKEYKSKFAFYKSFFAMRGKAVLCPADLPPGLTNGEYMKIDMAMIDAADAVFFLPDYKESKGATLEKQYCEYIGKNHAVIEDVDFVNDIVIHKELKLYDND